jgi:hypothetical protein
VHKLFCCLTMSTSSSIAHNVWVVCSIFLIKLLINVNRNPLQLLKNWKLSPTMHLKMLHSIT